MFLSRKASKLLLLLLASSLLLVQHSQAAASCGQDEIELDLKDRDRNGDGFMDGADVGLNPGDAPILVMDKCVTGTFDIDGISKRLTVFYTTTNGITDDQLVPVDSDGDGVDDLTAEDVAQQVWDWTEDAWQKLREYGFGDPFSGNNFNVVLFHENIGGRCCSASPPFDTIRVRDVLSGLRGDPRNAQWIAIHEFWHAVCCAKGGSIICVVDVLIAHSRIIHYFSSFRLTGRDPRESGSTRARRHGRRIRLISRWTTTRAQIRPPAAATSKSPDRTSALTMRKVFRTCM